jgi:hypothetical protein
VKEKEAEEEASLFLCRKKRMLRMLRKRWTAQF